MSIIEQVIVQITSALGQLVHLGSSASSQISVHLGLI